MKEKSEKTAQKNCKRQRKEKIVTGRDLIKREESEAVKRERERETAADKESIMKLCSAGSVKGSNLLIKDRD